VEHRGRVAGEDLALDAGALQAVAQVLGGILGGERIEVEPDVQPRVERAVAAHLALGEADEDEGEERLRVPLAVEEDVQVGEHLLVEEVRLVDEEDRVHALLGELLDVGGDAVEDRRGGGVRGEAQGEAELAVEVAAAERGVVAVGEPEARGGRRARSARRTQ
jgi:hypothetical protein